jgi:hypothetical protein
MTLYFLVKYVHVLGAIVILGTGAGIAFFMLMAHRSRDVAFIARTAETVVIADVLFTLTAVLLQPVSGGVLMWLSSTLWSERWLMASLGRSKCAISRPRRLSRTRSCRRAISHFSTAGFCSEFPVLALSWLFSG